MTHLNLNIRTIKGYVKKYFRKKRGPSSMLWSKALVPAPYIPGLKEFIRKTTRAISRKGDEMKL